MSAAKVSRPASWCYQCGAHCASFFADGSHIEAHPHTAGTSVRYWTVTALTSNERGSTEWLDEAIAHLQLLRRMNEIRRRTR